MDKVPVDRRNFLAGMLASALPPTFPGTTFLLGQQTATEKTPVADIFLDLDRVHKWDMSNGDTWDPFWADDGNLYAFNCDGRGFGAKGMNLAFNRLSGGSPSTLVGSQVNSMAEYGRGGQKGPDNATWKACGQECIDGVFYAFVSRNVYGSDSKDPLLRQLAMNASLIKSHDRGITWTRSAQQNYDHPMWPGRHFGAPFFIHYGQNGGQAARDGARDYVYAVSTNGFWNDGDSLILARVRRSRLPDLNSADWQYFTGPDGSLASAWSPDIQSARPILDRPAKCGQTPVCYVPALGVYLLISWYNTALMKEWFRPNEIRYDFYQALHPWGPWNFIRSFSDRFMGPEYHMYGPSLCARFQQSRPDGVEISLFTAGCPFEDVPATPYKLWHIPVLLRKTRLPEPKTVPASDPSVRYHGSWFPWTTTPESAEGSLPRATQSGGDSAELVFEGTGVEYIAQKTIGQGHVEIWLDGERQSTKSLELTDFPVLMGVVVFSRTGLSPGKHTIRIVAAGDGRVNIESFKVFPG